jgi:extracellular elastinolytic metalloproteinase
LIDASHSYVGDLTFTLVHSATGVSVTLIDRIEEGGCGGNDIQVTLDDEAITPVTDGCTLNTPSVEGTFIPDNPLSAFDGKDLNGTWRMTVADHEPADTGTLNNWCLKPVFSTPNLAITKTVATANTPVQPGDPITYTIVVANISMENTVDVVVADTLPAYVNGVNLSTTVTITAGLSMTFTRAASLSTDAPGGTTITNTATFSHSSGSGQASAAFTTKSVKVYLPVVLK